MLMLALPSAEVELAVCPLPPDGGGNIPDSKLFKLPSGICPPIAPGIPGIPLPGNLAPAGYC